MGRIAKVGLRVWAWVRPRLRGDGFTSQPAMHPERRKEMEYPLVGVLIEAFRSLLQGLLNLLG